MGGDQFVARKRGPPIALAACHKNGLAHFIGEPIERLLDGEIGAPLSLSSARVRKHVGPPFFACWLLRMRPRLALDCRPVRDRLSPPRIWRRVELSGDLLQPLPPAPRIDTGGGDGEMGERGIGEGEHVHS